MMVGNFDKCVGMSKGVERKKGKTIPTWIRQRGSLAVGIFRQRKYEAKKYKEETS